MQAPSPRVNFIQVFPSCQPTMFLAGGSSANAVAVANSSSATTTAILFIPKVYRSPSNEVVAHVVLEAALGFDARGSDVHWGAVSTAAGQAVQAAGAAELAPTVVSLLPWSIPDRAVSIVPVIGRSPSTASRSRHCRPTNSAQPCRP
jgi:hypothetical protein